MNKTWVFISLLLAVVFTTVVAADVFVKTYIGDVVYQKAGTTKWEGVKIKTVLRKGDTVLTKNKSTAVLTFLNGDGTINMSPNTKILMTENEKKRDGTPGFIIFLGNISGKVTKKQDTSIDFYTPTAVAGIRGTEFAIAVAEEGTARVGVTEGVVAVAGQSSEVVLNPGEGSTVPLAGNPSDKVTYSSKEDFSSWLKTTSGSSKGKESEVLANVEKALDFNYGLIDTLQKQSDDSLKKIETLKTEKAELEAKGDTKGAEAKGQEALAVIGSRTEPIMKSFTLDYRNQAIFEIAERIWKSKKSDKEITDKFNIIKTKFDEYHNHFVITKQKKGCL